MQGTIYKKALIHFKNRVDTFLCHNPHKMFESKEHCLKEYREIIGRILTDNVIPFWLQKTVDSENGGFTLNHSLQGVPGGAANRTMVGQARMLWFFARASRTRFANSHLVLAAHHGYAFMMDHLWDPKHGGFFWEVDHTGRNVTGPFKHALAQSFGIYALGEYARTFEHEEATEFARQAYTLLTEHLRDRIYGGYLECVDRDWSTLTGTVTLYGDAQPDMKTFNTHIHLLEALLLYNKILPGPSVSRNIQQLLNVINGMAGGGAVPVSVSYFKQDWRPCGEPYSQRVNYGHELETIWLEIDAHAALDLPLTKFLQNAHERFCYVLRYGHDHKNGGLYDHGPFNKKANARHKVWWPQAEALLCTLKLYQLTGMSVYINCFAKTLTWITTHQIDWHGGEWFERINELGAACGVKASNWKTPYHNGRALILCDELLDFLLEYGPQQLEHEAKK